MLNGLFIVVALASVLLGAYTGRMQEVSDAMLTSARSSVDLAIGLVGVMAFFLGLMNVAQDAGLVRRSRPASPQDQTARNFLCQVL